VRLEVARTSQVGEWASQSRKETFSHPVDLRKGGTDGRNPLRRFHEVPWAVGSHGGARRLESEFGAYRGFRRRDHSHSLKS
jgi:hypothetical protein